MQSLILQLRKYSPRQNFATQLLLVKVPPQWESSPPPIFSLTQACMPRNVSRALMWTVWFPLPKPAGGLPLFSGLHPRLASIQVYLTLISLHYMAGLFWSSVILPCICSSSGLLVYFPKNIILIIWQYYYFCKSERLSFSPRSNNYNRFWCCAWIMVSCFESKHVIFTLMFVFYQHFGFILAFLAWWKTVIQSLYSALVTSLLNYDTNMWSLHEIKFKYLEVPWQQTVSTWK